MHDPMRRIVLYWHYWQKRRAPLLWPVLWMLVIFWFSTDRFSGQETGSRFELIIDWLASRHTRFSWLAGFREVLHFLVRKLGHLTEYAILAILWQQAFRTPQWREVIRTSRREVGLTMLLVAGYALLDEWHQTFTATRTGTLTDCLIDFGGGWIGILLDRLRRRSPARHN